MVAPGYYDQSYPPSVWGGGQPAQKIKVTVASNHPDPAITALLPGQQLAAINAKYEGNPLTAWTAGQFATVAARQVAWNASAFADFVAQQQQTPQPKPKSHSYVSPQPDEPAEQTEQT
jgi:hypothetical protein